MPVVTQQAELPKTPALQPLKQADTGGAVVKTEETQTPKEETLSPKFVALARKEKAIRTREQSLRAREDAIKAKEVEYESSYIPKSTLSERFKQDPVSLLNEHGVDWDQLTQAILNQPGPQELALKKLEQRIKASEEAQTQVLSKMEEQQKRSYEQAVNQIRNEAKLLVDGDVQFETIKATGSEEAIVELIKETFNKDGTLLSVEDAAKEVEDYLVEESLKLAQLKKVREKLTPPQVEEAPKPNVVEKQTKTLTSAQVASSTPLTSKNRRDRAILAFQGKL